MLSLSYSTAKWGGGGRNFHEGSGGLDDVSRSPLKEICPPQKKKVLLCFRRTALWITVMWWSDKKNALMFSGHFT